MEKAMVSIAKDNEILHAFYNTSLKNHAAFLQPAIQQLVKETSVSLKDLNAISITAGPGSYTGLRVGMASAKGLCYALQKPLICLNTLEVMAASAITQYADIRENDIEYFCPMIDARREEVFMAIYDLQLKIIIPPSACILSATSFTDELKHKRVVFSGNGAKKWQLFCKDPNAIFNEVDILPEAMADLAQSNFKLKNFSELAQTEPIYLKEFYTPQKK